MSDSYQPIFDAVRSRIHNADVGDAVERAIRERFDVSHVIALAQEAIASVSLEHQRPCVLFRPKLYQEFSTKIWVAYYDPSPQDEIASDKKILFGTGASPALAIFSNQRI